MIGMVEVAVIVVGSGASEAVVVSAGSATTKFTVMTEPACPRALREPNGSAIT
jgi:microcompartment protein CcmK/EutM